MRPERPTIFLSSQSRRMTEKDLPALSIADLQSLLRRREVSAREVARCAASPHRSGRWRNRRLSLSRLGRCRQGGRGGECRSSARRHPGCDQRHHQCDGSAVYLRRQRFCVVIGRPTMRRSFENCAPRAQFHLAKPTWTSLPWVRPRRIRP